MNDIFLSYASSNRAVAKKFADALESLGWSVWWDREIPVGQNFDRVIEDELNAARCAIVLWSKESVASRWVRTEASSAAARACLIPVLIDEAKIPLEFTLIQAADLASWNGETADPEFVRLVDAIQQILKKPTPAPVDVAPQNRPAVPAVPAAFSWLHSRRFPVLAIAIVALIVAVILGRTAFQRQSNPTTPPVDPGSASTLPSTPGPDPSGGRAASPEGSFTIKIGDRLTDGVPVPGAGAIERPYGQDAYTFVASPGQRVYFRMLRHSNGMDQILWRLVDPDGMEVFNTCLACGEAGVQTLTKGGTYTLSVGGNAAPTGSYQLQLIDVPPSDRSSITIGQKIADNMPGPGAAAIETPGAEDIYTFSATPRQEVYFRMLQHSTGMEQIKWQLVDENMMEVFNTCLGCSEPGVQTLIKGGSYTLTVANKTNPATGTYALQLFNVPPAERFAIGLGDRIRPGVPRAGAGVIETPGAEDIYTFTATPGQKVYFHLVDHSAGMDQNKWRLLDDNEMELFDTCLACSDPAAQTLIKGGTYTLIVGSALNPSTGSYVMEIGRP